LLVDCQTRVISKWTLLEQYEYDLNEEGMEEQEFVDQFIGDTFLHTLSNRKITIDGFAMKMNPSTAYPHQNYATYADFYSKCFGIAANSIKKNQFLVYTCKKTFSLDKNGMKILQEQRTFYLPQFLKRTGMTDDQKKDNYVMSDTAKYTKINPALREKMQNDFLLN
jgi:hypothetical protein